MAYPNRLPADVIAFVHDTGPGDIPASVIDTTRRYLLDLVGVWAAGRMTDLSAIVHRYVRSHHGAGEVGARLWFDGPLVSPAGSAFAAASTIDAIDAHDGHKITKGHTGVHQLAGLLAFLDAQCPSSATGTLAGGGVDSDRDRLDAVDGADVLASLTVGYEFATRAGVALHATVSDYHTSGAWGAVGVAALGARVLKLDAVTTFEAMGLGEYVGPRSQMMRAIDHPTMVKDGSGWGAMAGVSAAYLAADGFTGAPAVTVCDPALDHVWSDLGRRWMVDEQYLKPYPVCRWAQPAVEAALAVVRRHSLLAEEIDHIEVFTFHEAARLATRRPATTEQAQYSLPFPVAAAVCRGQLGVTEVVGQALQDPEILRLADTMTVMEDDGHNSAFPANRYARVRVHTVDGRLLESADHEPRGDPEAPLTDAEVRAKFHQMAVPSIGVDRAKALEQAVDDLAQGGSLGPLAALLAGRPEPVSA